MPGRLVLSCSNCEVTTVLRVGQNAARVHVVSAALLHQEVCFLLLVQRQRVLMIHGAVDVECEDEVEDQRSGAHVPHNHARLRHARL